MHLTFFDTVFTVIILFMAIMGFLHGFINEIGGKAATIGSIFVGFTFYGTLAPSFKNMIGYAPLRSIVAFIVLFIGTYLVIKIVQTIMNNIFSGQILGSLNKVLGFAFGVLEGLVVVCLIFVIAKGQPWFSNAASISDGSFYWALLSPMLEGTINSIHSVLA